MRLWLAFLWRLLFVIVLGYLKQLLANMVYVNIQCRSPGFPITLCSKFELLRRPFVFTSWVFTVFWGRELWVCSYYWYCAILGMVSLIRSKDQTTGANNCSFPPFYLERAITPEYTSKGKGDFLLKLICFYVVETNYFKHISLYTQGQHEKRFLATEWSFSEEPVPSAKRLNWSSFFP